MTLQTQIRILNTPPDVFQAAATEFATLAAEAIRTNGRFTVALAGGSTPKGMYALLAANPSIPWGKIYFFFGDERDVPADHPDSNYRMACEAMLTKTPAENVFRVPTELKDDAAAAAYEQTLKTFFRLQPGEFPRFNLVLLGMGPDGHAASLFPGSSALNECNRLVVANWVEKFKTYRITVTFPVLNRSAHVIFLVCGPEKAAALQEVLENPCSDLPSKRVLPEDGTLLWLIDTAAATQLAPTTRTTS